MTLIGLCGKKRSGKDTLADYLVRRYGFQKKSFADKLKELEYHIFDNPYIYDGEDIALKIQELFGIESVKEANALMLEATELANKSESKVLEDGKRRYFLQQLGTEILRNYDPDIHIKGLFHDLDLSRNTVAADCRFSNEADAIKNSGGIVIKIEREKCGESTDIHASETELERIVPDFTIVNVEGNPERMFDEIDYILKHGVSCCDFFNTEQTLA